MKREGDDDTPVHQGLLAAGSSKLQQPGILAFSLDENKITTQNKSRKIITHQDLKVVNNAAMETTWEGLVGTFLRKKCRLGSRRR